MIKEYVEAASPYTFVAKSSVNLTFKKKLSLLFAKKVYVKYKVRTENYPGKTCDISSVFYTKKNKEEN